MNYIILVFITLTAFSAENLKNNNRKNTAPFAPSANPVSAGSRDNSGVSDGPLGPNEREEERVQEKAKSMGGAPNMGGGMGTGTGPAKTNIKSH